MNIIHTIVHKIFVASVFTIIILISVSCNSGTLNNHINKNSPIITEFTFDQLPLSAQNCYYTDKTNFLTTFNIKGINNNGVIVGEAGNQYNSVLNTKICKNNIYVFDAHDSGVYFVPIMLGLEVLKSSSARAISSNLMIASSSKHFSSSETATYYDGKSLNKVTNSYNSLSVSENGKYITNMDLLGTYIGIFNTESQGNVRLSYNNKDSNVNSMLYTVSNNGIAGGAIAESFGDNNYQAGVLCFIEDQTCKNVVGGVIDPQTDSKNFDAYIISVSANAKWIYGFARSNDGSGDIQLFSVNADTLSVTPLNFDKDLNLYTYMTTVTDDGIIILKNDDTDISYLLVPYNTTASKMQIYSIQDLARMLGIKDGLSAMFMSPNGHYIVFETIHKDSNKVLGIQVYLPNGLKDYLIKNLTPLVDTLKNNAVKNKEWFKGKNIVDNH